MIVTIAGIKRSGSTWLFNVVRIAFEKSGAVVTSSGANVPPVEKRGDVHLIKVHPYKPRIQELSDVVLTSYRNLSDIRASLERFNGERLDLKGLDRMALDLLKWQQWSSHLMVYERMKKHPLREVKEVMGTFIELGLWGISPREVLDEVQRIRPPKNGYDPKTRLFSNHITKG